ncbi:MarR family transcriptional regulator [Streptomyces sp. NBC_00841]|uniref:sugar-binding transcriptional regulator n=1 Tax=unclassified Streptomyces TaxID=2593676 RepID=UPI002250B833|nr:MULTISPECIES: sugar-binding domain-containing protein [unclassified Streptomyces]MCX4536523.1 MarR family transcriptional regulator [Streptomyces sp. NBC_01669]WRZ98246.1 MarR family transcriptional regulator [Streptomyces sp. NBC_00841]
MVAAGSSTPSDDHMRLLVKVARMYHERGVRQPEIAAHLNLSQARVSRLLKEAVDRGVVRTVVVSPEGVHAELEDALVARYGLRDAVVVEVEGTGVEVIPALAAATATYLDATLKGGDVIGVSSWSATLLEAVKVMRAKTSSVAQEVVQLIGGSGSPEVQLHATRLTSRLAELTGARPVFAPSAALVGSRELRDLLSQEPAMLQVTKTWSHLTLALLGIGSLDPSPLLRRSGNAITAQDQQQLKELGAVGDVCARYFDAEGNPVDAPFNDRLIGIDPDQLRAVDRRIGVAGGMDKAAAIRGAARGGWINILITDVEVARDLLSDN